MKKLITILSAICLVFAASGNAMADFHDSSLSLSIYNGDTNIETGYDLGTIGVDLDLDLQNEFLGNVDVSDAGAHLAIYSWTQETWTSYHGTTYDTTDGVRNPVMFSNGVTQVWNFGYSNGDSPVTVEAINPAGNTGYEAFGTNGAYINLVVNGHPGLMPDLANLATEGFLDIYLYQNDGVDQNSGFDPTTPYAAIVRIDSAGDVTLNPNAVPVPAGIWLLGSGLLGLIGIRRKKA